jgi:probable F420-dependent oxidoreductase
VPILDGERVGGVAVADGYDAVMTERMRIGIVLPLGEGQIGTGTPSYRAIRAYARTAEAAGLDSVWVFDHLLMRFPEEPESGIHEAWTILSALAEATERVELGTVVMCTSFRNPALLAKMAAALDEVSGGRLILGLGCGWHDPEYEAFGYPTDHRVGRFEEALAIIEPLLRGQRVTYEGRFHATDDAVLLPPPPRRDIPILVAAGRPRMLAITAERADLWNTAWFARPDDRLSARRSALSAAVAAAGRDPRTVGETVGVRVRPADSSAGPADGPGALFIGTVEELADLLDEYAALGIVHRIAWIDPADEAGLRWFEEGVTRHRERTLAA